MRRFRRQFSPASVIALIALFVALAGTATAGSVALITGAQIKNGSITGADVKKKSLTAAHVRGAVRGARGTSGPSGPAGPPGVAGPTGPTGPQGPPGLQTIKGYQASGTIAGGTVNTLSATCPAGEGIVSGGGFTSSGTIFLDHRSGNGWAIGVDNFDSSLSADAVVYLYCAPGTTASGTEQGASVESQVAAYRAARD
jgi:hypothetical protein